MRENVVWSEEKMMLEESERRVSEVCGDKQYPVMVHTVSVVSVQCSLMHCTAGPRTIQRMHTAWHICISIICGCHKFGLMELSESAIAY